MSQTSSGGLYGEPRSTTEAALCIVCRKPKFTAVDVSIHTEFYDRLREFCARPCAAIVLVVVVITIAIAADRRLSRHPGQDEPVASSTTTDALDFMAAGSLTPSDRLSRTTLSQLCSLFHRRSCLRATPLLKRPDFRQTAASGPDRIRACRRGFSRPSHPCTPLHYFRSRYPLLVNCNYREWKSTVR